jgi:membrane fusion protein (multidrug efflux system)
MMTDSQAGAMQADPSPPPARTTPAWVFTTLRVLAVVLSIYIVWYIAGHWERWTGAARFETTDDAFISGDVTPLAAKVSGYIKSVAVNDFQPIRRGDVIVEIDAADYNAALVQAQANVSAAQANLANLANQKDVQRALIQQADATIVATTADLDRYNLETARQRNLLKTGIAGTPQGVEQADDNSQRTAAQLLLNKAQLTQQKAILASLDVEQVQLEAQVRAAKAQAALAQNNVGYTRIVSPDNGIVGQRLVRPGQFVNIGTQVIAVVSLPEIWVIANYKETQMTNVRLGQPATVHVDAFPDLKLTGRVDSWSPGTGSTFALLPPDNATGNFTKVVQRVPVKILLDHHPALGTLVRPGMSVEATIDTGSTSPETADKPTKGTPNIPSDSGK